MGKLIDQQVAIGALCRRCDLAAEDDEPCTEKCNDIKILEKLPSAQPENTDCIYCHEDSDGYVKPIEKNCHALTRQALDALKDTIGVTLHVTKISKHCSDFSDLDEVIECEDAVNRQKLLNDLGELITAWKKYPAMAEQIKGVETAIGYVKTIPPVTPKRKTGRWIELSNTNHTYICSECGRMLVNISDDKNMVAKNYPFCHCGAEIGKREENK